MPHLMHEYTEVDAATQLEGDTVIIDMIDDSKLDIMYITTVAQLHAAYYGYVCT